MTWWGSLGKSGERWAKSKRSLSFSYLRWIDTASNISQRSTLRKSIRWSLLSQSELIHPQANLWSPRLPINCLLLTCVNDWSIRSQMPLTAIEWRQLYSSGPSFQLNRRGATMKKPNLTRNVMSTLFKNGNRRKATGRLSKNKFKLLKSGAVWETLFNFTAMAWWWPLLP